MASGRSSIEFRRRRRGCGVMRGSETRSIPSPFPLADPRASSPRGAFPDGGSGTRSNGRGRPATANRTRWRRRKRGRRWRPSSERSTLRRFVRSLGKPGGRAGFRPGDSVTTRGGPEQRRSPAAGTAATERSAVAPRSVVATGTDRSARFRTRPLVLPDDELAVDDHVWDTVGISVGILESGGARDELGIEHR